MKKKYLGKDISLSPELRQRIIDDLRLKEENYYFIINIIIIMEYQKVINLLDNSTNQPSKFINKKLG